MKRLRSAKIFFAFLWLTGVAGVLIFWLCHWRFPWNTTNLWLIPLELFFPLWALCSALRKKAGPLAWQVVKGVILLASLLPVLVAGGFSLRDAIAQRDLSPLSVPVGLYMLESRTDNPADYGKWDVWVPEAVIALFPQEIPANAKNTKYTSVFYSRLTAVRQQQNTVTLRYILGEQAYKEAHLAQRKAYIKQFGAAAPASAASSADPLAWMLERQTYRLTKAGGSGVSVTFDPADNSVCYRYGQAIRSD